METVINSVCSGIDPSTYNEFDATKWYTISCKEQYYALLDSLNCRGIREQQLLQSLNNEKVQIVEEFLEEEKRKEKLTNKRLVKPGKKNDNQSIDKNLFRCMEDYIEGSLRDAILELEERIWVAGFGGIKTDERLAWRENIEEGMAKLIQVGTGAQQVQVQAEEVSTVIEPDNKPNGDDLSLTNGDKEMEVDQTQTPKAVSLHLQRMTKDESQLSRCSTPVDEVLENTRIEFVCDLAQKLLAVTIL